MRRHFRTFINLIIILHEADNYSSTMACLNASPTTQCLCFLILYFSPSLFIAFSSLSSFYSSSLFPSLLLSLYDLLDFIISITYTVGTAIRLQTGRPWNRDSIQDRGKRLSLFHSVQSGSMAHPACCLMGTGCSVPGGKGAGARN
jgi:hypothetical protein